jgi:uncharacterized protein
MIDVEQARALYSEHDAAHGWEHVLRVWRMALRIAREEGADAEIASAAALLHDVGRAEEQATGRGHAAIGGERARDILAGQPPERVEAMVQAIAQHRFRGGAAPQSPEARVLFDADKLDAIGAIGVARAYAVAGATGQRLWAEVDEAYAERDPAAGRGDLDDDAHTPVHEFRFKLDKLPALMTTATGRRLAEGRQRTMRAFYARLEREVQGEE